MTYTLTSLCSSRCDVCQGESSCGREGSNRNPTQSCPDVLGRRAPRSLPPPRQRVRDSGRELFAGSQVAGRRSPLRRSRRSLTALLSACRDPTRGRGSTIPENVAGLTTATDAADRLRTRRQSHGRVAAAEPLLAVAFAPQLRHFVEPSARKGGAGLTLQRQERRRASARSCLADACDAAPSRCRRMGALFCGCGNGRNFAPQRCPASVRQAPGADCRQG